MLSADDDDDDNNGDPGGNGNFASPAAWPEGQSPAGPRVNVNQDPNNSFNSSHNNNSNSNYIEKLSLSSWLYKIWFGPSDRTSSLIDDYANFGDEMPDYFWDD